MRISLPFVISMTIILVTGCSEDLHQQLISQAIQQTVIPSAPVLLIGSWPRQLIPALTEAGIAPPTGIAATNWNDVLPKSAKMLVLNADDIPNVTNLAESKLVRSAMRQNIPIIVGGDKEAGKKNELTSSIGGVYFDNYEFAMVQTYGTNQDTTNVTPIGHAEGSMAIQELNAIVASLAVSPPETTEQTQTYGDSAIDNSSFRSVRVAADDPYSYTNQRLKYNLIIYGISRPLTSYAYGELTGKRYWRSWRGYLILGPQSLMTSIMPGQGQITFRKTTVESTINSHETSWNFKTGASLSVGDIASIKASAWWNNEKSNTTSYESSYGTGYTTYTQPCFYACCGMYARYVLAQNIWNDSYRMVGTRYYIYYPNFNIPYHYTNVQANPLTLTANRVSGVVFSTIQFIKVNANCNLINCKSYTSKMCAVGSIGK